MEKKEEIKELIDDFVNLNKENMSNEKENFFKDFEDFMAVRLDMVCLKLQKISRYKKLQDKFDKTHDYFSTKIPQTEVDEFERDINKIHEMEKVYIYMQGLIDGRIME